MNHKDEQPRRGRPPFEISEQLRAHFAAELAKGRKVAEIARQGLMVYGYSQNGELVLRRQLKGKHLEAAFRKSERLHTPNWLRRDQPAGLGKFMFMGRELRVPTGAAVPFARPRGRPKKNLSRGK